jgi:hypothetical protein
MYKKLLIVIMALSAGMAGTSAHAQLLKKLKDKVNQVTDKAANKTGTNPDNTSTGTNSTNTTSSRPTNKAGGGGLVSTPPDIVANINSSETAFKENKYSESRFALQQAILGTELQIGKEILKSLPDSVLGSSENDRKR